MMHERNIVRKRVTINPLPGINLEEFQRKNRKSQRKTHLLIIGVALFCIALLVGAVLSLPDMSGTL